MTRKASLKKDCVVLGPDRKKIREQLRIGEDVLVNSICEVLPANEGTSTSKKSCIVSIHALRVDHDGDGAYFMGYLRVKKISGDDQKRLQLYKTLCGELEPYAHFLESTFESALNLLYALAEIAGDVIEVTYFNVSEELFNLVSSLAY